MQETWVQSLGQEDPWRQKWQPTSVFLFRESHGQRSLAGLQEQDMNQQLNYLLFAVYDVSERHTGSGEKSDGSDCPEI